MRSKHCSGGRPVQEIKYTTSGQVRRELVWRWIVNVFNSLQPGVVRQAIGAMAGGVRPERSSLGGLISKSPWEGPKTGRMRARNTASSGRPFNTSGMNTSRARAVRTGTSDMQLRARISTRYLAPPGRGGRRSSGADRPVRSLQSIPRID